MAETLEDMVGIEVENVSTLLEPLVCAINSHEVPPLIAAAGTCVRDHQ